MLKVDRSGRAARLEAVRRFVRWLRVALWLIAGVAANLAVHAQLSSVWLGLEGLWASLLGWLILALVALPWEALIRSVPLQAQAVLGVLPPLLLLLGFAQYQAVGEESVEPAKERQDMVLITLDTLRADHVGAYGGVVRTPNLDAFAASGRIYRQAVSPSPLTLPAHAALFTGREPEDLGVITNAHPLLETGFPTALSNAGWATAAFVGARVLARESGILAGFQHADDRWSDWWWNWLLARPTGPAERAAPAVIERANRWMKEDSDRPRFMWVHLYDAHAPYQPPLEFQEVGGLGTPIPAADPERDQWLGDRLARAGSLPPERLRAAYKGEVEGLDQALGALLAALPPDALVVIVADHGEGLGEHGAFFVHGSLLHEPAVRVPLMVRWPGKLTPGTEEAGLVTLSDIAPLFLSAAGLREHAGPLLGVSADRRVTLFSGADRSGRPTPDHPAQVVAGVRGHHWKLVAVRGEEPEFFDLNADPGETHPLPVPVELDALAIEVRERSLQRLPATSPEWAEKLRSLGYLGDAHGP